MKYLLCAISTAGTTFGFVVITSWPEIVEYRLIIAGIFWLIATTALVGVSFYLRLQGGQEQS